MNYLQDKLKEEGLISSISKPYKWNIVISCDIEVDALSEEDSYQSAIENLIHIIQNNPDSIMLDFDGQLLESPDEY